MKARFVVELVVGPRSLAMARELLASVAACCTPGEPLLIQADHHHPYPQAILSVFGVTYFRRRKRGRGRRKLPRLKPPPGLMVGIVQKVRDASGRLLRVKQRSLFGRRKEILACLQRLGLGQAINTSHLERLNGTLRTQQTRLARRTRNVSRDETPLQHALWLWRDLYHFTREHGSLRDQTPAMALGLAKKPWSVAEYVLYPVHVGPFQRALWQERREQLLTTGLNDQKRRKALPIS